MRPFGLMTFCYAYAHATLPRTSSFIVSVSHGSRLPALLLSLSPTLPLPSVTSLQRPRRPSPSRPMERRRAVALFGVIGRKREGARRVVGGWLTKKLEPVSLLGEEGVNLRAKSLQ